MKLQHQIHELLKQGEHQRLDFKKRVDDPAKVAKTLVAFANSEGGMLLIGVDDDGEITGIDPNEEKFIVQRAATVFCEPKLKVRYKLLNEEGLQVLLASVEKSDQLHLFIDENGKRIPYVRVGDKTRIATDLLASQQAVKTNHQPIPILDERTRSLIGYLQEHHSISPETFASLFQLSVEVANRSLRDLETDGVLEQFQLNGVQQYRLRKR